MGFVKLSQSGYSNQHPKSSRSDSRRLNFPPVLDSAGDDCYFIYIEKEEAGFPFRRSEVEVCVFIPDNVTAGTPVAQFLSKAPKGFR